MSKFRITTIVVSVLLELVALAIAAINAGAGHGTFNAMRVLFPYTMIGFQLTEVGFNPVVAIVAVLVGGPLVFVQYPLYGVFLILARPSGRTATVAIAVILCHIAAADVAFLLTPGLGYWP